MAVACPDRKNAVICNCRHVMVATQNLGKQLLLQDGKLNGKDVQVLLDSGSETSIARASLVDPTKCTQQMVKVKCVHGDVITYPSAIVELKIDGWEREITVVLVPDVPVDVVPAWNDHHCPTVELTNLCHQGSEKMVTAREGAGG